MKVFTAFILLVLSMAASAKSMDHNDPPMDVQALIDAFSRKGNFQNDPTANCQSDKVVIPFKRAGRLLIIQAQVDSIKGNFVFDTGAPYLILNKTYFRKYTRKNGFKASGITGGNVDVLATEVTQLSIGPLLTYADVEADVVELGHIENARGIKVLGLLGLNLFKAFVIEIDLYASTITLYKCDKKGAVNTPSEIEYDLEEKIDIFDNSVFVDCSIEGKRLKFGLDSGAEINALNSNSSDKILETVRIAGRSQLLGSGSESVEIFFGRMGNLTMGTLDLSGMQTVITQLDHMEYAYGKSLDGMLGYEFFTRGIVEINIPAKTLKLRLFDNFRQN